MNNRIALWIGLCLLIGFIAACGGGDPTPTVVSPTSTATIAPTATAAAVSPLSPLSPLDAPSDSSLPTPASTSLLPDVAPNADGFTDISVEALASLLPDKNFTLVNVHIPYEGELPETDLFLPYNEISAQLDALPNKDAPIVLYCRSGSMSTQAAKELVEQGYTNIYELDGGFNAWARAGYELLQNE